MHPVHSQEDEGEDEPRSQKYCDSVVELVGGLRVGSSDTVVGDEEG